MPTKTTASAPAGSAELQASETKPKAARRVSAKRKPTAAKRKPAAAKTATSRQPKAKESALRSQAAMVKLQSAVDQLEAALRDQPVLEAAVIEAAVPAPPIFSLPAPAPRRPEVEVAPEVWSSVARPALATAAFLVFVATLMVGYSTGYAVGTNSVDDPMVLTASASERPVAPAVEPSAEQTPAPMTEAEKPAPVVAAATPEQSSGLHLQVSALKSLEAAAALGARLENEGYPVKVRKPEADGLVRVLVGPVSDSDQLSAIANRLREEGLKPFPKRL